MRSAAASSCQMRQLLRLTFCPSLTELPSLRFGSFSNAMEEVRALTNGHIFCRLPCQCLSKMCDWARAIRSWLCNACTLEPRSDEDVKPDGLSYSL